MSLTKKLVLTLAGAAAIGGCSFVGPKETKHPFTGKGVTVTYSASSYKINLHLNRSVYVNFDYEATGRDLKDKARSLNVRVFPNPENVILKDEKCDGSVDEIIENGKVIVRSEENEARFKEADKKFDSYLQKMKSILDLVNKKWEKNYKGVY